MCGVFQQQQLSKCQGLQFSRLVWTRVTTNNNVMTRVSLHMSIFSSSWQNLKRILNYRTLCILKCKGNFTCNANKSVIYSLHIDTQYLVSLQAFIFNRYLLHTYTYPQQQHYNKQKRSSCQQFCYYHGIQTFRAVAAAMLFLVTYVIIFVGVSQY